MKRVITPLLLMLMLAMPVLAGGIQEATISLPTIQCGSCKATIGSALKRLKGVRKVKIDVDAKSAVVKFDSGKLTLSTIENAIAAAGYDANSTKADPDAQKHLSPCCRPGGH